MTAMTDIYVNPIGGCDWYRGEVQNDDCGLGALKTLEHAIRKISVLRQTGENGPVTVWLAPGKYFIDDTITIPKNCDNITFRPLGGKVEIIGAKRLQNACIDELFGVKCISAEVPCGVLVDDLFVNGKRADITRYPESGYLSAVETGSKTGALYDGTDWMIADRDLSELVGLYDATVVFRHFWIEERLKIESFDAASRKAVFDRHTTFTALTLNKDKKSESLGMNGENAECDSNDANSRMDYIIEGLPQMLKKPNEWVYVKDTNKIYYIPNDFDAENELYVPTVTKLFDIYGDNISFENIDFKYTSSHYECSVEMYPSEDENAKKPANDYQAFFGAEAVINFIGARNCRVENCGFSDYGLYGIDIDNECRNIDITRCRFENSGGGGIKIRHIANKTDFDVADNINISDCLIKNIGLIHTSACGILITLAQNCRISHNEICYTGYSGISVGWEWGYKDGRTKNIIIEKNHIHHISQGQLSDLGGIYLLGIQKGSIIRGNLIHDVVHKTYGASGIYADEGTSLVTFENNICYNTEYAGFQLHFGYGNIIRNNIFESGSLGSFWLWRHDAATAAYLKHNILIAKDKNYIFGGQTVDVLSSNVERDYNLYFDYTKTKPVMYKHFKTEKDFDDLQKEQGSDKNSIVKDPMFADYENKNFSLTKASPAKEIGFFDIDMSDVGIRR